MNRVPLICAALAVVIRLSFLVYTLAANRSPVWPLDSHDQLQAAVRIHDGAADRPAYVDDFGLRYVHVLLSLFGGPSFLRLQLLQICLDSLMVLVAWQIGKRVGGLTIARVSAFLYAVFLPEVVLAVVPSYDVWASWALLLPVWLLLESLDTTPRRMAVYGISAGFVPALLSIVRSTTMFFGPVTALALLCFGRRRLPAFVLPGWLAITLPLGFYKYQTFGEVRPIRGSVADMFWVGVGQFPNTYGVEPTDAGVHALYQRLGGKAAYNSQEYEALLLSAAFEYLRGHPLDYMASVAKRSLMILLPKNYWGPWVDQWHPRFTDSLLLLAQSPFEFAFKYPVTAILGVAGRIMDWIILPIAVVCGGMGLWKRPQFIVVLPLLYTVATLAPLYVTPRNTTNAYAAILPVCAFGLVRLGHTIQEILQRFSHFKHLRPLLQGNHQEFKI